MQKKYNIIYADPPWSFKTWSNKGKEKSAENHYPVMRLQDIKDLPVQDISADDCVLFLWVTFPNLREGLEVIDAWGFTYKTCAFNWVKRNKKADTYFWGLGYWTRSNSELCLLATKGKPLKRMSRSVHEVVETIDEYPTQILDDRIMRHSKKPDIVRDNIVELLGDHLPKIELFARQRVSGWDALGFDINGEDIKETLGKYKEV